MPDSQAEFAILGAGAMGSVLGAHLAQSGHAVLMLARHERARQVERDGLRITGLATMTQHVPVLAPGAEFKGADVLIVATKTYGMAAALAPIRAARIGSAFSIQNGLMKNEQLARVFGAESVLGALANTSAELQPSGEVLFTRNEQLCIGEPAGGFSARARNIARLLDASGIRTSAVDHIRSLEWAKFAAWVGLMVVSVMTRSVTGHALSDPDLALVLVRLVREVGALAEACEVPLSDQSMLPVATLCRGPEAAAAALVQTLGAQLQERAPAHRMSTLQDLEAGRPLEIEETLGFAVQQARQLKVALPFLENCYVFIRGMDRIRR